MGTPLVAIIPSAITGALSYARNGLADVRSGVVLGLSGALTAVLGAWSTRLVGGPVVLVATAVLILYVAADMLLQVVPTPTLGPSGRRGGDRSDGVLSRATERKALVTSRGLAP